MTSVDEKPHPTDRAFWQTKGGIAVFTAMVGLMGSLSTATYSFVGSRMQLQADRQLKSRELSLAELKEDHTIEKEYFLKAVDSANSPDVRARILRYLTVSPRVSPEMKDWARAELLHVDSVLKADAEVLQSSIEDAQHQLDQTVAEIAQLPPNKSDSARSALAKQQQQQAGLIGQLKARAAEARTGAAVLAPTTGSLAAGRTCEPGSVRAVNLGPDDPEQSTANGHCGSSAAGRQFDGNHGGLASWLARREGRNFQCECRLR